MEEVCKKCTARMIAGGYPGCKYGCHNFKQFKTQEKEEKCCNVCVHFRETIADFGDCFFHECIAGKKDSPCMAFKLADFDEYIENHLSAVVQSHDFD